MCLWRKDDAFILDIKFQALLVHRKGTLHYIQNDIHKHYGLASELSGKATFGS